MITQILGCFRGVPGDPHRFLLKARITVMSLSRNRSRCGSWRPSLRREPASGGPLARGPHRERWAVTAAVGGPVRAVADTASPLGGPRLVLACQPTGGALWLAVVARARLVVAVLPVSAQSADRSTQRRRLHRLAVPATVRRWVAPASCGAARHIGPDPPVGSAPWCTVPPPSAPLGARKGTGYARAIEASFRPGHASIVGLTNPSRPRPPGCSARLDGTARPPRAGNCLAGNTPRRKPRQAAAARPSGALPRSEEHTSELQS